MDYRVLPKIFILLLSNLPEEVHENLVYLKLNWRVMEKTERLALVHIFDLFGLDFH